MADESSSGLARLERSCVPTTADWLRIAADDDEGLTRIEANLDTFAYTPHRHDDYAIGLTLAGVQMFGYRGTRRYSEPGHAVVLYPDEWHDGEAGTDQGLRYRMLYVRPGLLREALDRPAANLPFVGPGHSSDPHLRRCLWRALSDLERPLEPLERDAILADLADALTALDSAHRHLPRTHVDQAALHRVRERLDARADVSSAQLERMSGLSRYELARQFRAAYGTSPHRYLTQRRLERARRRLSMIGPSLADIAADCGFADQSHLTRQFKRTYGLTPGRWRALCHRS